MEIAIGLLALSSLLFVVLVVRGVRAVGRGVRRAREEVGRTVSEAALAARAVRPGAIGEVARLRRELRSALDGTRATLLAGSEHDPALREALALLDQLAGHAGQLDGELGSLMVGEPDRARIGARLPELRQRADRIRRSADALRFAAQERAHRHDAEGLEALHRQIDLEAGALRHWAPVPVEDGPAAGGPALGGSAAGEPPAEEPPGAPGTRGR
jgi:hypothetical protein